METTIVALVAVGLFVVVLLWFTAMYNTLVRKRVDCDNAFSQIDVQLKRRYDLIPNLVDAVKGYMGFEESVLTAVTEARANAVAAGAKGTHEQALAENALTSTLRSLFATVENYPDLKANQNFLQLQTELVNTEDRIQAARRFFNGNVRDYRNKRESFPSSIIASVGGFGPEEFFQVEPSVRDVPNVDL